MNNAPQNASNQCIVLRRYHGTFGLRTFSIVPTDPFRVTVVWNYCLSFQFARDLIK